MSENKKVVIDVIDVPEISDSPPSVRPRFNREREESKETVEKESKETKDEETGETVHPMEKYTSHRHNITDRSRQFVIDTHDAMNKRSYASYQSREFWKRRYQGAIHIMPEELQATLDSRLHAGKYKGLSVRCLLYHQTQYLRWMTERCLFKDKDSLFWRCVDLLLPPEWQARLHNQEILKELREHKKEQKRKFESNYDGKYKKFKKFKKN